MAIRILHLSDFHFGKHDIFDRHIAESALLRKIQNDTEIDIIAITGDVAYSGEASQYATASVFLQKLLNATSLDTSRIIICAGNHDVYVKDIGNFIRTLDSLSHSDAYFKSDCLHHLDSGQKNYLSWYEGLTGRKIDRKSSLNDVISIEKDGMFVELNSLNTAIFCRASDDHGKLFVGRTALSAIKERNPSLSFGGSSDNPIRIIIHHHPIDWLHFDERSRVSALIRQKFDVGLRGHLHESEDAQTAVGAENFISIAAGAIYQGQGSPMRANLLDIDLAGITVSPIAYVDSPSPAWVADLAPYASEAKSQRWYPWKNSDKQSAPTSNQLGGSMKQLASDVTAIGGAREISSANLLRRADGVGLYVNPRICSIPFTDSLNPPTHPNEVNIFTEVQTNRCTQIEFNHEYGATTLAQVLVETLTECGYKSRIENATDVPNYEKKFNQKIEEWFSGASKRALVIDNAESRKDKRLAEICKDCASIDLIVIFTKSDHKTTLADVSDERQFDKYIKYYIWPFDRARVRDLALQIFQPSKEQSVNSAVDKTYLDLLSLAIPLTPANCIMYLHILHRERNFVPVDRVSIIQRYVHDILSAPSEQTTSAFGARDKINFLAQLVYDLFSQGFVDFDEVKWQNFCRNYKNLTLDDFDERELLDEFLRVRILERRGHSIFVRFAYIFDFLIGVYAGSRSDRLNNFISMNHHRMLPSVVEVVTSIANDPTELIDVLQCELDDLVDQFQRKYVDDSFDPVEIITWKHSGTDEEYWANVSKQIDSGPSSNESIDDVKTSLFAETRTARQDVVIREFAEIEVEIFRASKALAAALRVASGLDSERRIHALRAILKTDLMVSQIATAFSVQLACSRYFVWGGILFINENPKLENADDIRDSVLPWVSIGVDLSLTTNLVDRIGTRRLGGLFKSFRSAVKNASEFELQRIFALVLRTKPMEWEKELRHIIEVVHYAKWRQKAFVKLLMSDYKNEVNTEESQARIKSLIAFVEAKRIKGIASPGAKLVNKVMANLEESGKFDIGRDSGGSSLNP